MKVMEHPVYTDWLDHHKDARLKAKIVARKTLIENGNLGDHHSVGDGVSEIRINYGPGYRFYYTLRGREIIILLVGGDKSTQQKDIKKAQELVKGV